MSEEEVDPKLGTVVGGYRLDERLGAGGMGVVYGASKGGQKVAVKFLHDSVAAIPDLVKRFDREVEAMRRAQHPRLVAILDSGAVLGVPYLVMERLAGRPLGDILERGALSIGRAQHLAREILEGVGAAHERGVIHRDLKPDNIIVVGDEGDEHVKILDFGLAKVLSDGSGGSALTRTGFALGTPSYMSPEQAKGTPSDQRADLYAVGVILYQMVVGRKPFVAESPLALLRMHMDDAPLAPRKASPDLAIPERLERAILRALEKDPAARWQDAAAFMRALGDDDSTRRAKKEGSLPPLDAEAARPGFWDRARAAIALGAVAVTAYTAYNAVQWARESRAERALVTVTPMWPPPKPSPVPTPSLSPTPPPTASPSPSPSPTPTPPPTLAPPPEPSPSPSPALTPIPELEEDDDNDDEVEAPKDTPGAALEAAADSQAASPAPAREPTLADAKQLVLSGKVDEGVQLLYRLRRKSPRSGVIAAWLGHAYFRKLWRTDALREYSTALALQPGLRSDPLVVRNVVVGLEDPTYRLARAILRKQVGKSALGELRKQAREAKNPKLRVRATFLLGQIGRAKRR